MDLRRVRYFVAVAEHLHFGRAAERMNIVQPAISQQIKRLEEELGIELFERSGSRVRLTESGQNLLPECIKLLRQADETERIARAVGAGTRGRVNFGFVDNAICALLPPLVRTFRSRFPDVEVSLQSLDRAEQLLALQERRIDIGLLPGPMMPQGDFDCEGFVSAPLIAALPGNHRLATEPSLSFTALAQEPFVLFPHSLGSRILELILAECASASFTPRVAQEATQIHTLLALVDAGLGVTLVPRWVAHEGEHKVVFRAIDNKCPPYELIFAWRRDTTNLALQGLLVVAQEVAQSIDLGGEL